MYESKFLHLRYKPDMESNFQLAQDFHYRTKYGVFISVPEYFETDLASIPAIARPVMPKHGKYTWAAVVHDYLYRMGGVILTTTTGSAEEREYFYTRKWADQVFYDALLEAGVDKTDARLMYWAVRIGGAFAWD